MTATSLVVGCSTPEASPAVDTAGASSALPALPSFGDVLPDSGPPVQSMLLVDSVRLVMRPNPGDQINALQPPVLETDNGRRILFGASAVTSDSAYFVGEVSATFPDSVLPMRGVLTTSYCRADEKLCRSAKRLVAVGRE